MENKLPLLKLGRILYEIYDMQNYKMTEGQYDRFVKHIISALKEIRPEPIPRILNPDIKDFVEQTNRRLNNG